MDRFLEECENTADNIIETLFIQRDGFGIRQYVTEDISMISSISKQTINGAQNVIKAMDFRVNVDNLDKYQILNKKIKVLNATKKMAIFSMEFAVIAYKKTHDIERFNTRSTFVMVENEGSVKCNHIHLTIVEDETILNRTDSFAYLRKAVDDKTEQMNMMFRAINGGLKENWYDSNFTLLFLSEELCRMVGYTKAELENEVNIKGVNLIYSADRERVRSELEEFVNNGDNYFVEYRMNKKDGSLIWVSESGKIGQNEYGQKIMHSLVMDITEKKTIQLELEKERQRYEIAMENSTDIIFEYDIENDIFVGYQNVYDGVRHKLEKTVINNYTKAIIEEHLVKKEDRKTVEKFFVSRGTPQLIEVRMRKASMPKHKYQWMQIRGTVTYDMDATKKSIVGIIRDIERLKSVEKESNEFKKRFAIAIRNSYDNIYEINLKTKECFAISIGSDNIERKDRSARFEQICEKIQNTKLDWTDLKEFRKIFNEEYLLRQLEEVGGSLYYEVQDASKYPNTEWCSVQITKASWDDNIILAFVKNIDEIRRAEETQRKALRDALLAAQRANMAKTDFLSRMSHDIRTPMNAVIGMTDIAGKYIDDKEKVLDCLNKIEISSKFLIALINDILDMSKIESQKLVLEKKVISIRKIVEELSVIVSQQARTKNIDFQVEIDESVEEKYLGDALRINQIIMNFLSNAVKFTANKGKVELRVIQLENTGKWANIEFVIKDTGEGMTKEFMEKMYNPFEQEDTGGYKHKGSGLGLAIAKNLVSMMNGSIDVESTVGKGTTFYVKITLEIPIINTSDMSNDSTERNLKKNKNREISFENQRVLLVEDNEINMEIAKTLLEFKNLQVEVAENGLKAVEKVKENLPNYYDAILMDIRMPVMDGLTASKEIRTIRGKDLPIIAMSANAFREDIENAIKSGINGYVTKPIDADTMYEEIRKAFDGNLEELT